MVRVEIIFLCLNNLSRKAILRYVNGFKMNIVSAVRVIWACVTYKTQVLQPKTPGPPDLPYFSKYDNFEDY